jgi:RNA polymerase sigma factor (sigma-70 family)
MADQEKVAVSSSIDSAEIQKRVGFASEVFQRYGDEIRALIHFNVRDKTKEDDIFQELFVSIIRKPIPSGIQDVKAYVYRTVTNDVIDMSRQTKIQRDHLHRYAECRSKCITSDDPQKIAIRMESTKKMFQLIENHLPKREAEVVLQRFGHGFSVKDTAQKMDVDKRIVSRYLSIALKRMRHFIHENEEEKDDRT